MLKNILNREQGTKSNERINIKSRFRYFKNNFGLFILTVPALIYFIIFKYLPMFGVVIAFKDYSYSKGILGSPWNGLKNFEFFFTSQDAWRITRNTVAYNAVFIVVGIVAAVSIALLMYELKSRLSIKIYQTTIILPRFLSWVIVAYIAYIFLNPGLGVLNQICEALGLDPVRWYVARKYWPYIITLTNLWKNVGLSTIIYFAALMGIDPQLYEAARIDGASRWQQIRYISIPSLIPLMIILSIIKIGYLFRGDFGLFYQIPRDVGFLYPVTDIIDTYVFRGLRTGDLAITAAVGFFQSFVGLILVVVTNKIVKKISPEHSLF